MRRVPRIKTVMTPFPHSIAPSASLDEAQSMMSTHDIRHLPVCDNHLVVGVLSERELRAGLALRDNGSTPLLVKVDDVCLKEPLLVDLDARLDVVATEMASRRVGSAIVMRGDKLAGILTTTDVLPAVGRVPARPRRTEDDDVA